MTIRLPDFNSETAFDAAFGDDVWLAAARAILAERGIDASTLERAGGSEHIVFFVGESMVLKIFRPFRGCYSRELAALEIAGGRISLKTPEIVSTGCFEGFDYILMTRVEGDSMARADWLRLDEKTQLRFGFTLGSALREMHELPAGDFENNWPAFVADRAATFVSRQIAAGVNQRVIDALPGYLEANLPLVRTAGRTIFMHADIHFGNLTVASENGSVAPFGLFDFADSRRGHFEYDFLAPGVLMFQGQREIQREFFKGYGYAESDLNEEMRRRMMMLTMLYETADLRRYALRLAPEAVDYSLEMLEQGIWNFV